MDAEIKTLRILHASEDYGSKEENQSESADSTSEPRTSRIYSSASLLSSDMLLPLLVSCLTLAAGLPRDRNGQAREWQVNNDATCNTEDCNMLAVQILKSMNKSADPCESFYDYACGSWLDNNPIPPEEVAWSQLDNIRRMRSAQFREILEEEEKPDDIPPVKITKRFYKSCMDVDGIEKRGIKTLAEIVDDLGGWPIAMPKSQWHLENLTWQDIDKEYYSLTGSYTFFNVVPQPDDSNSSLYILTVDQDISYPFNSKVDKDSTTREKNFHTNSIYWDTISEVALYFAEYHNISDTAAKIVLDAAAIVNFEVRLGKITKEPKQNHVLGKNNTRMTIAELQEWYDSAEGLKPIGQINWLEMIRHMFNATEDIRIDETEPILVANKECLHQLAALLSKTPLHTIVNYMHWMFISKHMAYTNELMRELKFNTTYGTFNITKMKPRWITCVDDLPLKDALSYMYVKKYFSDETLPAVWDMVDRIQDRLKYRIEHTTWLTSAMKKYMTDKVNKIVKRIGYPDWYRNDTYVSDLYTELEIGSDYLENVIKYNAYVAALSMQDFREPVDKDQWENYPLLVNAFYYQAWNSILIPAAEIQAPYFTPDMPSAINYGSIGFVIGHEMGHSIDNDAIEFDQDGTKLPSNISDDLLVTYKKKADCFVEQYNNYTLDIDEDGKPIQLDGELTQSENMADTFGVQLAFSAYQEKMKEERGIPRKLNNLAEFTDEQLFFLSLGTTWCSGMRPNFEESHYNSDVHSPAKFRIDGALSNLDSFATVFHCPPGSLMNSGTKCNLWR